MVMILLYMQLPKSINIKTGQKKSLTTQMEMRMRMRSNDCEYDFR